MQSTNEKADILHNAGSLLAICRLYAGWHSDLHAQHGGTLCNIVILLNVPSNSDTRNMWKTAQNDSV